MRCTRPRDVGFHSDGKTLCWSPKKYSKEFAIFQLPCGKCLSCRLEYARQWSIRCLHESLMHPKNSFITLTYSDEHLKSEKLIYSDFQKFMKKLRKTQEEPIGCFVTGEYGERTKRPHWHAILFNYRPSSLVFSYSNDRGDKLFNSPSLDKIWGLNDPEKRPSEIGEVTYHSAGYVARYAAKKLVHGHDQDHGFHPISRKSSKHAIGKKFIEKHWEEIFNLGECILPDGTSCSIPRYYEKWLKENQPDAFNDYVTGLKNRNIERSIKRHEKEAAKEWEINEKRLDARKPLQIKKHLVREKILEQKFDNLQKFNKL